MNIGILWYWFSASFFLSAPTPPDLASSPNDLSFYECFKLCVEIPSEKIEEISKHAENGHPFYIRLLAREQGIGLTRSEKHRLLELSAELGHALSQYELAYSLYYEEQDWGHAKFWAERSAEQGLGEANLLLSELYENRNSTYYDLNLAAVYKRRSAISGRVYSLKNALESIDSLRTFGQERAYWLELYHHLTKDGIQLTTPQSRALYQAYLLAREKRTALYQSDTTSPLDAYQYKKTICTK